MTGVGPPRCVRDRGAAVIWVLACGAVVLAVAYALTARSLAVLARHRAESAADLAALAAATRIGVAGAPCAAAQRIALDNRAVLQGCTVALDPSGRSGTVLVRIRAPVHLPVVGSGEVRASARAARMPPGSAAARTKRPACGRVAC